MDGEPTLLHQTPQKRLGFFAKIQVLERTPAQANQLQPKVVFASLRILLKESPSF
jgi:hypothetical protein